MLRWLSYNSIRSGPWHYAIVGFHELDPCAQLLEEYRRIEAAGRLYIVSYPEGSSAVESLRSDRTYVEAACIQRWRVTASSPPDCVQKRGVLRTTLVRRSGASLAEA